VFVGASHVGPLFGRRAAAVAVTVVAWLKAKYRTE
jgi:hypothetical protein